MKQNNQQDGKIFGRLVRFAIPLKKSFIIAFVLMIFSVGLNTVMPLLNSQMLSILGEKEVNKNQFFGFIVVYVVLILLLLVISFFQHYILQKAGQRIIYSIREQVFYKIENFSNEQLNKEPVGKYVTRVTNDTQALNEMYTSVLVGLLKNVLQIIFVFVFMMITSVKFSLITLAVAPIVLVSSIVFRKFSRRAYRDVRKNISNMNAFLNENISGIKITQGFSQEEKQLNKFVETNNALKKSSLQEVFVFGIFRPFIYVLYISTVTLVLFIGGKEFLTTGLVGYVTIYTFYLYIEQFFQPIQQLADQFNTLQSAMAASERIFDIIDTDPMIKDKENAIELEDIKGRIEFKNVWFAYIGEEWILKDVSFVIEEKQTVAFVGATGSGKTTILSLIVRNYDIQKGQILIDGIDIKDIKLASLRSKVGQMLQDVFLFNGSIKDNITMFENIDQEEVEQASKFVNANKFIEKLPNKYDEIVKERGNNFSAGERQLLSFARCIVKKPSVMILDEATANIDTETEVLIQDSLEKMMNVGTMLIVAHRLSTIQYADNIIVMRKGRIIESGTHQELLSYGGHYYDLYKLQYRGQNE